MTEQHDHDLRLLSDPLTKVDFGHGYGRLPRFAREAIAAALDEIASLRRLNAWMDRRLLESGEESEHRRRLIVELRKVLRRIVVALPDGWRDDPSHSTLAELAEIAISREDLT